MKANLLSKFDHATWIPSVESFTPQKSCRVTWPPLNQTRPSTYAFNGDVVRKGDVCDLIYNLSSQIQYVDRLWKKLKWQCKGEGSLDPNRQKKLTVWGDRYMIEKIGVTQIFWRSTRFKDGDTGS
jgi:hypothetical protein